jgi:predicted nicotinamide N-methyase
MSTDYVIFHDNDANRFEFDLFGSHLSLRQKPSATDIGHGAVVWEASAIFTKYMEHNSKKFTHSKLLGKTVIELGSGCGLGGIGYMMRGATVVLTDLECVVNALTRENASVLSLYFD